MAALSPAASLVSRPQPDSPASPTLRLTVGGGQFRPGEIIPIELEFNSATSKRFTVDGATSDRSGRLTLDEFAIDRIDDVSDPMLDYFGAIGGSMEGGPRGIGVLGEKPFTVKLELNDWFRFDKPGMYTLAVTSHRVTDESVTPPATVPVASNTVSFEIVARDAAWEESELARARRIIDAKRGAQPGCRMLRFLGTEASTLEIIRRYGADGDQECDFDYMIGLFSAPNRAVVVREMEAGLRAPDHPVTQNYLRTLSMLSVYLQHPGFRPAQTPETKGRRISGGELSRRFDLVTAAMSAYGELLTAALPDKTGRARAITLAGGGALVSRQPSARSAAWREQLAAAFLDLPVQRQANLLEFEWRAVAGPAMLPALRRLVDAPATDVPSLPDLALRRLAQLAPDEARPLLLREIRHPRRGATPKTLGRLPDAELPDLDDALAANLEASSSEIHAALVHRYATKQIAARVLANVDDRIVNMACRQQTSILAYFLRVDEPTGARLLDRAMTSRVTGCWRSLNWIAEAWMTPVVEARAIADLDNPDPEVVVAAVQTLGPHGSAAALEPLQAAFRRWHATWATRAEELTRRRTDERPNASQAMVEDAFRQAIGTGRNWLIRAEGLRQLQSLCVTDNCRTQTGHMIDEDDTRIMLWDIDEPDASHIGLAQYRFTSIAALEAKLTRYPRGTAFTVQRSANAADEATAVIARLVAFADAHGLSIRER